MRRIVLFCMILAVILTLSSTSILAQQPKPTPQLVEKECDLTDISESAEAFENSGDEKADGKALIEIGKQIQEYNTKCHGLTWTGTGKADFGPISLTEGIYLFKLETLGSINVNLRRLGGDSCEPTPRITIFNIRAGQATDPLYFAYTIRIQCNIMLSVANSSLLYTLSIVPVMNDANLEVMTPTPSPTKKK